MVAFTPLLLTKSGAVESPKNFFANPSFEMGRDAWQVSKAGKTYTFAVFAKSTQGPIEVGLQVERNGTPWDKAGGAKFKVANEWQELHVTFTVEKDFPEGWFAYLNCTQPKAELRLDMFRLYEGQLIPDKEIAQQDAATVAVRLFDSGAPGSAPLPGKALSRRTGWAEVPEDDVTHTFKGDAVFMNDRLAFVLRRGAPGAEVYSISSEASAMRTVLAPGSGQNAATLSAITIVENNPGAGVADAVFATPDGQKLTLRFELKLGQPVVQTEARGGVTSLRVEAPCRYAVMPDFFADDIVIDAAELPVAQAELPSDNFLLHLLPDRQAMVMTVVKTSEEDIRVAVSGQGEQRRIGSSELRYGKDGRIWVAVLTGSAVWHRHEITGAQAGQVIPLDWRAPFPAQWRVDWRRQEGLTDSWEMIAELPDGSFAKHGVYGGPETIPADRQRWTTVLGWFNYPAWLDRNRQGYLQPIKSPALRFQGPAIIYPLSRVSATGLDSFTVLDIVRNTLGVGPCEYILDVEGQQSRYQGRATCAVRDTLNPIYAQKRQKQERAEIEQVLQDLMIFIRHIRGRIESYVAFGHQTLAYVSEQKQAHPELADRLAELETLARGIDAKVAARKERIKTPDQAAAMVEEFRKTVLDYEGDDALTRCTRFTEGWVDIGGNQDELVGECRWAVKMIRQRAGLLMAIDLRMAEVAKELRQRSQIVLRNPANHEGARH